MTWTSALNNGVANDSQIVVGGPTVVCWAIGDSNSLNVNSNPNMNSVSVVLVNGTSYGNSVELTSGLTLNWNVIENSKLELQAVYTGVAW